LDQLAPGGSLEWTVSGSGLGGIADLRLLDTLGDGQRMDTVFHPQVVIRRGSVTVFSGDLLGWSGVRSADTATTAINFDLAPTLRAAGLASGLSDDSTVTVTFHSTITSLYAARQAPALGRVLGQGDLLRNAAVFSGTLAGTLSSSDPAVASLALPSSVLAASIYAVNGVLAAGTAHAAFGDTVTYRIQIGLPLTAAHHVQLTATLPGLTGPFVFDAVGTTGGPPSGHVQFGPGGTYTATQPSAALATDAAGNPAVRLDFGDIQPVYGSRPGTIDLLVSAPLQPGASLAATVTETEANSFGTPATVSATTAAVALNEPSLHIQTATVYASNDHANWTGTGGPFGFSPDFGQFGGIVSSAGLATEPFADQLRGIDAGDDVTFVIAVENLMPGAKAYDVMVRAALPDGFVVPNGDASITVSDGAGTPLAYTGNLFDAQGGLLLDPKAPIGGYDADSGQNILLISYTLRSTDRLDLGVPNHVSTAQIVSYATEPGWANRVPQTAANTATTGAANLQPGVTVVLLSTSPDSAGTPLALGGTATFRLTATLPEGLSRGLDLSILLPAWLTAVSARVVAVGANITPQTQAADGHGGIAFGDTLNAPDGQDTAADQVQIEVTVRPDRLPDGPAPHAQTIQAAVSIGPPGQVSTATGNVAVGIADPVAPTITQAFAGTGTLVNGQVATLRFTVTLPPGFSTDFRILDSLPAGLAYVSGSAHIVRASGVASHGAAALSAPSEQRAGSLLTLDFGAVDALASANRQVTIELQAQVAAAVGTTLINSVTVDSGYAFTVAAALGAPVVNTAPTLVGLPALEAARDDTALLPFGGIMVTDPDTGQQQTLQITLSSPANGVLTSLGTGRYDASTGMYTVTGTADAVTTAAAALRFVPTRHQTSLGQQVPTDFSVQVHDSAGAGGPATVTRVATAAVNTAPTVRNAAPGQAIVPGAQVRLFSGLLLQDPDAGQTEALAIQFANPAIGTLRGTGPGHYNPATGLFTSKGTLAALMAEAAGLVFNAGGPPSETFMTVTIDDGAGGVAQDTSTLTVSASTPSLLSTNSGPPPFAPTALPAPLFIGPAPANLVTVPAGSSVLAGTAGRDAYFVDGNAAGLQWDALTGFGGGDAVVLWGFRAGISIFAWSDSDGPAGATGRTLRADIPGTGTATTSLSFTGRTANDTDRFAISIGRFNGVGFLSITSPS
jgi:fimbrial isopeptide formation D2 family protein